MPNQLRYDPDVGFTFLPNLQTRIPHETGGYLVRVNALGFRDNRTPGPERDGRRPRVLIFGDSFTAGDGVSNDKRFSDELARLVPGTDVYNFGLPGTGTDQQFIAFNKFARDLACDLVIVAVLVENIRRITAQLRPAQSRDGRIRFVPKPYFELHDGKLARFHDPVPEESVDADQLSQGLAGAVVDQGGRYPGLRKLVKSLGLKEVVQRLTGYQPVPDYDSGTSPAWLLMRALLLAWREASRSPLLVVPLPLYQHVEETADARAYQQRFRELASETGIAVHDVLPDLQRYSMEERRGFRFATDVHLTPAGHRAVARSLAPAVSALLDKVVERGSGVTA
ncbi:MAG: SGNH/GDSL hydrolase family protein [Deltaproteobacteria bacterium]|nr:SGNH/GDSL hydrolase family protein [Deltaproteobacteria bacterium]